MEKMKIVVGLMAVAGILAAVPAGAGSSPAAGDLEAVYKKGEIRVNPDPEFGKGTEWPRFIETENIGLAVAPDGSLFLTQQKAHAVNKFDRHGRFLKKFGRQGQGPGDLQFPQYLSVLDGKYLVVGEHAESRRVSLFDLDGNFVKVVKTGQGPFSTVALRDGIVAYVASGFRPRGPLVLRSSSVILLDTATGHEKAVADDRKFAQEDQVFSTRGGPPPKTEFPAGSMIIARTAGGDLAVGFTTSPKILIFSPDGRPVREFTLDFSSLRVTDDLWRRYQEASYELQLGLRPNSDREKLRRSVDEMPRTFASFPYYSEILTDVDGRLLVVRKDECFRRCDLRLRVYAADGRLVGETLLRGGEFETAVDRRFRNIAVTADALYGVFPVKGSPDDERRLVRVAL